MTLRQMRDHASEALGIMAGRGRRDLDRDRVFLLALSRLVEIIGEAAGRVPAAVQAEHPTIPWPQVIGMRNRLIHGYDEIDLDVLWNTLEADLPDLVRSLESIVGRA